MRHDHVLVRAGHLVEVRAAIQAKSLRDVDLDVVDEVPVPDGLEQPVGETERKDVQRGFLAEEVVDPEDLPLLEGLVDLIVQSDRTLQVGAEGFSMTTADVPQFRLAEGVDDLGRGGLAERSGSAGGRRVLLLLRDPNRLAQPFGAGRLRNAVSRSAKESQCISVSGWWLNSVTASLAKLRNSSSVRSSSEVPTTWMSGASADKARCARPGSSLRRERSPVARRAR